MRRISCTAGEFTIDVDAAPDAVRATIAGEKAVRALTVVVLTSSGADRDVAQAYALNANCFVTKPIGLEQFLTIVRTIEQFRLTVVKLPPET